MARVVGHAGLMSFRRLAITMVLAVLSLVLMMPTGSASAEARPEPSSSVVVSLTFDDGQATQYSIFKVLKSHDVHATFYVNSGMVGSSRFYMGWQQIYQLANAGNEIGGATSHHVVLDRLSRRMAVAEVCGDRDRLIKEGLAPVTSFAYPTAVARPRTSAVASCGYKSARTLSSGAGRRSGSIPPRDPYLLPVRASGVVDIRTTVRDLQQIITTAEKGRGTQWVILVFHAICDSSCTSQESTTFARFDQFVRWLDSQRSTGRVAVRTVGDVIAHGLRATTAPNTTLTCNPSPCSRASSDIRVSLDVTGARSTAVTYYTTDGTDPKTSASWQRYIHPFGVSGQTVIRYYSRDAAGRSESSHTWRVPAGGTSTSGSVDPTQARGVTPTRRLIARASVVMLAMTLLAGIFVLRRRSA